MRINKTFINFSNAKIQKLKEAATTMALGEEGGNNDTEDKKADKLKDFNVATTMALGEEGGNDAFEK